VEKLRKMGLNDRQIKAVNYVKEKGRITNKEYQELNLVSKRTASRDLDELVKRNIIDQIGITGKGTEYVLRGHKGVIKGPMTHITAVTRKGIIGQMPQQSALMAQRKQSSQTTQVSMASKGRNGLREDKLER